MIDCPGDHPPPHVELPTQGPLIFEVLAGAILYRHHQKVHDPIYFGTKGDYRFDWSARLEMCQWIRENWTRRAYGTGQEVPA